ncbi:DUF1254 domain-containing protein [Adhaeribacter soli]|uniref:DUF1254 domain-containing protein n=1 Tax=Adhaeribacter soli TaxID=2607655 RepID=A0A5N1IS11_9BACT|nr:DUF1254 domain-containing protein [Adhaeribacter soli]KAA9332834.1 DUF1254 domain-containing protein [Adhaeribacter soli]
MKNTTPIPPGIASPDKVDTRLGTLNFFDGFPDDESVKKLYDNLDYQRAVQAYLLALAAVSQVGMKKALLQWGPANFTLLIWENRITPKTIFWMTQNVTPYSNVWIDLNAGPLVVVIPPKVLGIINDIWAHWISDVGFTGPDKGDGGKYLLLPPGYADEIPEGYIVVRPKTFGMFIFWRSFLDEKGDPKPGVEVIRQMTQIYPLTQADNPPKLNFVDVTDKYFCLVQPADYAFWEYLNEIVQAEPSDSLDPVTLGFFRSIGISKGKPFSPDDRMKAILREAAAVGDATARALTFRMREKEAYLYGNSSWRSFFVGNYAFLEDGVLVLDAYTQAFFIGGAGTTPAIEQKMIGQGSQYVGAFVDSEGRPFDGAKTYKLHLPPNIPVKNFWSITVYDNQTRSQLQTDQPWPAINSHDKGFGLNEDGSADVYFGPEAPAGKENNWIQTIPGKGWNTALRLYGPLEPWFEKNWRPGEIELVK